MSRDVQVWEYKVEWWKGGLENLDDWLNRLGKDGWELIEWAWAEGGATGIFKRPKS